MIYHTLNQFFIAIKKINAISLVALLACASVNGQAFTLLKDVNTDPANNSYPQNFLAVGDRLFFAADNGINGVEVWRSDGTPESTFMLEAIYPGSEGSHPKEFTVFGDRVIFSAENPIVGREPWMVYKSASSTVVTLLNDLCPGPCSSNPKSFCNFNGWLYFSADNGTEGRELWVSVGIQAGEVFRVRDINPTGSGEVDQLTAAGNKLFFVADGGNNDGIELWKLEDGNYTQVKDIRPGQYSPEIKIRGYFNGLLYFIANDGTHGDELWTSDGTEAGTFMLKDINAGPVSSSSGSLAEYNGKVLFVASTGGSNKQLWITDGTQAGTVQVTGSVSNVKWVYTAGNTAYCAIDDGVRGEELWTTDGTSAGTQFLKEFEPGVNGSYLWPKRAVGNDFYFEASTGAFGAELYKSDGTAQGTGLVKDFNPGNPSSTIREVINTDQHIHVVTQTTGPVIGGIYVDDPIMLPLTLLSFAGERVGKDINLQWKTTDEHNISEIVLERSANGTNFAQVASFEPVNHPGEHSYYYKDPTASITTSRVYYRLKMVDRDGSYKLTEILQFRLQDDGGIVVYPNPVPANSGVQVSSGQAFSRWSIISVQGAVLKTGRTSPVNAARIPVTGLAPGSYFLSIETTSNEMTVKRLIVQ